VLKASSSVAGERRHEVADGPPADGLMNRPTTSGWAWGGVRLGDIAGVSGFSVGHRLAGPRLPGVDDGGEVVDGAAPRAV
jgi:hypothetical protein